MRVETIVGGCGGLGLAISTGIVGAVAGKGDSCPGTRAVDVVAGNGLGSTETSGCAGIPIVRGGMIAGDDLVDGETEIASVFGSGDGRVARAIMIAITPMHAAGTIHKTGFAVAYAMIRCRRFGPGFSRSTASITGGRTDGDAGTDGAGVGAFLPGSSVRS